MGKRLRVLLAAALITLSAGAAVMPAAAQEEASIEQVYVNLPEVTVYGTGIREGIGEAYLGEQKLENTGASVFSQKGEPIYYYVLLDVSNSMPEEYFDKIKTSIQIFEGTLGEKDRMMLYTFGEQVELRLDENHTPSDTQTMLGSIDNTDNKTLLFEAISQAADKADQVPPQVSKRRVLAVISDGEDFTVGKTGAQEAQENLQRKGIPVYAFGIADTARENTNNFGTFARNSGGRMTVFGADQAETVLNDLHKNLTAYDAVTFRTGTNVVSNRMETFTLKTAANQTLTRDVLVSRYVPDQTVPVMIRVEKVADDQIEVEFSEAVKGADAASAYTVTREEEGVSAVAGTGLLKDKGNTVLLTFTSDLKPGKYTVSCTGITDLSMEGHAVENSLEFEVEQLPLARRIGQAVQNWYWIFLILIAVVLILVIVLIYRKVKKGRGVIYVDGKPVIASDVEIHKHVAIQEQEGKPFQVKVSVKGNKPENLDLSINDSFIVGRSQICNLYFDDKKMSRQHFALEWDGSDMYVTDLETTNGTMVGGVKINRRRRLEQGDKISAGSVEMTIRW